METLKDFFYYNRKIIILVVCLFILYFISIFVLNNKNNDKNLVRNDNQQIFLSVEIKGEIKNPGIYKMKDGMRIIDVIEKSGGLSDNADISSINVNSKIIDKMFIYIPKKEMIKGSLNTKKSIKKVKDEVIISINTSSVNELMKIKGFGRIKAESIVNYRQKNGNFKKLEDLMKVKGIGKKTFDKIKNYIKL